MSAKWVLFKTVQREPANKLACYAMADLLEWRRRPTMAVTTPEWLTNHAAELRPGKQGLVQARVTAAVH